MAANFLLTAVFCVVLTATHSASLAGDCGIPRELWCQSRETATRCGVVEECTQMGWLATAPKVNLSVYHEAYCIDCGRFIQDMLLPTYLSLNSIMDVTLVPFGGAKQKKVGDKWVITCLEANECQAIAIEACAVDIVKDMSTHLPFVSCFAELGLNYSAQPLPVAKKCASRFQMPLDDILKCSKSDHAGELLHRYGDMTESLQPQITWFPWMVLNGVHTAEIQKQAEYTSLVKLVCDTYKGPKPAACSLKK